MRARCRPLPGPLFLLLLTSAARGQTPPLHGDAAAAYSEDRGGRSLLVLRGGEVVHERYAPGSGPDEAHPLHSGTKSFWGLAALAAVQDGWLDLEELACETLTEWAGDPLRSQVRVRHLLELTSGLDDATRALQGPATPDTFARAVTGVAALDPPGAVFRYGPSHFFALGALLARKLAAQGRAPDPLAYLEERLLRPIGLTWAEWRRDAAGQPHMASGASLTAREWAKVGLLLLGRGAWEGRQLLDPQLLERCFQGSQANPAYGLTFWLNRRGGVGPRGEAQPYVELVPDLVMAAGFGNQRLYVSWERDLVVVRQGEARPGWDDGAFLSLLLTGEVPPGAAPDARWSRVAARLVERQDVDGDGRLAPDELGQRGRRVFARLDGDGDGLLDRDELARGLEAGDEALRQLRGR